MSRRGAHAGMSRGVQRALGLVEVGTEQIAPCTCGGDRIITTDGSVFMPGLLRLGRMIDYCNNCNGIMHIYPGPRMRTRADADGEWEYVKRADGVVYPRLKRPPSDVAERQRNRKNRAS